MGPPFFNQGGYPIALFLLLLTAVGPLLAWRKTSFDSLKRNFVWPALGALVVGILMVAFGVRPWTRRRLLLLAHGRDAGNPGGD